YFQAGRVCGFIAEKWGYAKLLAMMYDFAANATTPQVIEKELSMRPEEFDKQFMTFLDGETRKIVDGFDDWKKGLKEVVALAREGNNEEVIQRSEKLRDMYPDYVEAGNLYEMRSEAFLALNNKTAAMEELERYAKVGGRSPETLKKLAGLQADAGHTADA